MGAKPRAKKVETPEPKIKKFWIVKMAPTQREGTRTVTGNVNNCYSLEDATNMAKEYASKDRRAFCVLELVACYEPISDVREVEIE